VWRNWSKKPYTNNATKNDKLREAILKAFRENEHLLEE
jgi:hypothetical protein